jgi:hypothetical protein
MLELHNLRENMEPPQARVMKMVTEMPQSACSRIEFKINIIHYRVTMDLEFGQISRSDLSQNQFKLQLLLFCSGDCPFRKYTARGGVDE